jgi:hypothetical protein
MTRDALSRLLSIPSDLASLALSMLLALQPARFAFQGMPALAVVCASLETLAGNAKHIKDSGDGDLGPWAIPSSAISRFQPTFNAEPPVHVAAVPASPLPEHPVSEPGSREKAQTVAACVEVSVQRVVRRLRGQELLVAQMRDEVAEIGASQFQTDLVPEEEQINHEEVDLGGQLQE